MTFTRVDWAYIHSQTFFTAEGCWTTCNGGFCCSIKCHPDLSALRFIPTEGATMIYLEEEYSFLRQNGRVSDNQAKYLSLDFGMEKPLRLISARCLYMGLCRDIIERPLLCKLYPYFPVFSLDGNIENFCPVNIFDLTLGTIGEKSLCTIKKDEYINFLNSLSPKLSFFQLLNHPYFIFHSMAAKIFADIYINKLKTNKQLMDIKGKDFWRMWEYYYLSGKLFDMEGLKEKVAEIYKALKQQYPGFSL